MKKPNPISVIFGIIQTALYADFAWVYWSRQRVKLRNGGVVDADDLSRGWLLRRIFGNKRFAHDTATGADDDEEGAPALGGGRRGNNNFNHHDGSSARNGGNGSVRPKWGSRGISISADEGVLEHERERGQAHFGDDDDSDDDDGQEHGVTDLVDPDAKMRDPDELARAMDEEEEGDARGGAQQAGTSSSESSSSSASASASQNKKQADVPSGLRSGDEWDDD